MVPVTPDGVPSQVVAGDSLRWRIPDSADYPQSEGWVLHYRIVGKVLLGGGPADITAAYQSSGADQGFWLVTLATTVTDDLTGSAAGRGYRAIGRFVGSGTYAGREETISDDVILVLTDPRTAAAGDYQSHAQKMVDLIRSELEARIAGTGSAHDSYQIDGRALNKIPMPELRKLLRSYQSEVNMENAGRWPSVKSRFTRVCD